MRINSLILLVEFIPEMADSIFFEYLLLFIRFVYLVCAGVLFLYGLNCIILSSIYLINRKKIWSKNQVDRPGAKTNRQYSITDLQ